jgi:hypothetical protein
MYNADEQRFQKGAADMGQKFCIQGGKSVIFLEVLLKKKTALNDSG